MFKKAVARAAERSVTEFNAQGLANTEWAFATVNRPHSKLFMAFFYNTYNMFDNIISITFY